MHYIPAQHKSRAVYQILVEKKKIARVAREFGVARKTIYSWIRRYQESAIKDNASIVFAPRYVKGENHPRAIYPKIEKRILELVALYPEKTMREVTDKVEGSLWTIWAILDKYNLNSRQQRFAFAYRLRSEGLLPQKSRFTFGEIAGLVSKTQELIRLQTRKIPKLNIDALSIPIIKLPTASQAFLQNLRYFANIRKHALEATSFYQTWIASGVRVVDEFNSEFTKQIAVSVPAPVKWTFANPTIKPKVGYAFVSLTVIVAIIINGFSYYFRSSETSNDVAVNLSTPTPITKQTIKLAQAENKEFKARSGEMVLSGSTSFKPTDTPTFTIEKRTSIIERSKKTVSKVLGASTSNEETDPEVSVKDIEGREIGGVVLSSSDSNEYEVSVTPTKDLKPGRYLITFTDSQGNNIEQDFTWGVLAVNTNKSMYRPNETAELAFSVLDETGYMVCDAFVALTIRNTKTGKVDSLTTSDGDIAINPECYKHQITQNPDYAATYTVGKEGRYEMTLTADSQNGRYTITDSFEVRNDIPFDIDRYTGTRIYPMAEYPVVFTITPERDYRGFVTEKVPSNFKVRKTSNTELAQMWNIENIDTERGVQEYLDTKSEGELQTLEWLVDWKKGQTYYLTYVFDAPDVSPDFYLLGPLWIDGFEESRRWQLAIDVVPSGVVVAWPSTNASIPSGWTRVTGLDTYYLEGTTSDPSATPGGAATHTHTSPSHSHTIAHTHTGTTSAASGSTTTSQAWSSMSSSTHDHTITTDAATGSNNTQTANLGATSNDPPYTEVIWIQSNGTADIPDGAWAWHQSDTLPTNWTRQAGNTFLKGAQTSGDGGATDTTGQSDAHAHTDTGHTHTENSHTHTGRTDVTDDLAGRANAEVGTYSYITHTHTISNGSTTATEQSDSSATVAVADSQPPYIKLNIIENATGGNDLPVDIIAAWVGSIATIPAGWELCDGNGTCLDLNDKFIKGANSNGESGVDSGGGTSHSHGAGNTHTHTIDSHTHNFTVNTTDETPVTERNAGQDISHGSHGHTLSVTGGGTTGTATITASTSSTETRPPYKEVAYIRKTDSVSVSISGNVYNYGTGNALSECDHTTPVNNVKVRAGDTTYTTSCNDSTGAWSVDTNDTVDAGGMVVWIDGETTKGAGVIYYDGSGNSNNNIFYDDAVTVTSDDTTAVTTTHMNFYDGDTGDAEGGDADIPYTVTSGNLTLSTNHHLISKLKTGVAADSTVFDPGGTVTTQGSGNFQVGTDALVYLDTATNSIAGSLVIDSSATAEVDAATTVGGDITVADTALVNLDANVTVSGGDITVTSGGDVASSTGTVTLGSGGTIGGGSTGSIFQLTNLTLSGSGTTTLGSDADDILAISGDVSVSDGTTLAFNDKTLDVNGGNITSVGTGAITCSGCTAGGLVLSGDGSTNGIGGGSGAIAFYNLTLDGSTSSTSVGTANMTIMNDLTIGTGRTLVAPSGTLYVGGDFDKDGNFTHNSGTLNMNGAGGSVQTITGSLALFNMTVQTESTRKLVFEGIDIAADGDLNLGGTDCNNMLIVRSVETGMTYVWTITPDGTGDRNIAYVDFQDVENDTTFVGVNNTVDSGHNSGFTFNATSCIGANSDLSGNTTGNSFQRKNFYDAANGNYWLLYYDSDEIEVRYSEDGTNWASDSNRLSYDTDDFTIWTKTVSSQLYVYLAVSQGNDIIVRRGSVGASAITWDATAVTALNDADGNGTYSYPFISIDSNDHIWVGARQYNNPNYNYVAVSTKEGASSSDTAETALSGWDWSTTPHQLTNDQTDENVYGNITPLASGDMYATFVSDTALEGCRYDDVTDDRWEDVNGDSCTTVSGSGSLDIEGVGVHPSSPAKIDDAGDPGSLNAGSRQIVRNSEGIMYTFINDGGSCEVWSSSDGSTWSEEDSSNNPSCTGGSTLSLAMDSADMLHLIYMSGSDLTYMPFSTTSDTFTTISVATVISGASSMCLQNDISVDINNAPHVICVDESAVPVYRNKVGGAWNSTITIETSVSVSHPNISINDTNLVEITYVDYVNDDLTGAVSTSNNPAVTGDFTKYDIDTSVSDTSNQQMTNIAVDTLTGDTWIAYLDSGNTVSLAKHTGSTWGSNWSTVTDKTDVGYEPSIAINGKDIYVFYQDDSTDQKIVYDVYDSVAASWAGETTLHTPSSGVDFRDVKTKWSYVANNFGSNRIDYLFTDGADVFYDYLYLRKSPVNISGYNGDLKPVTHWDFDEGAGEITYNKGTAGSSLDGNLAGTGACPADSNCPTWTGSGKFGNSISFSSDDYVNMGDLTFTENASQLTWTFWINPASLSGLNTIFSKTNLTSEMAWTIGTGGEGSSLLIAIPTTNTDSGTYAYTGSGVLSTDTWAHFAVVYDGTESVSNNRIRIYKDGQQISNSVTGTLPSSTIASNSQACIGSLCAVGGYSLNGIIDEVKVYDYSLSSEQVVKDMYANAASRSVVRISDGDLYSLTNNDGNCEIWKSEDDGASWTQEDTSTTITCTNSVAIATDSSDDIHIVYSQNASDAVYRTFDTSTDEFTGTPATITDITGELSLAVDSADALHVAGYDYADSYVKYKNNVGSSWNTTVTVEAVKGFAVDLTIDEDDLPIISYINYADNDLTAAVGASNNPTTTGNFIKHDVDTSVGDAKSTSVGVDSGGNTWISYSDENGTSDYITLAKRTDGSETSSWTTGWTAGITNSNAGYRPSLAIEDTTVHILYHDDLLNVHHITYDGSDFGSEEILEMGNRLETVESGWDFTLNYDSDGVSHGSKEIDYIFSNGSAYWYNRILLGTPDTPGTQDSIDTTINGVSRNFSLVSNSSDTAHIVYVDDDADDSGEDGTSEQLAYKRWTASGGWGSVVQIDGSTTTSHVSLSSDTDTGDLYAVWTDTANNHIYYRQCDISANSTCATWENEEDWKTSGVNLHVTTNYSGASQIFASWTVDSSFATTSAGSIFSSASSNTAPSAPQTPYVNNTTAQTGQASPVSGLIDHTPAFSAVFDDADTSDTAPYYELEVGTDSEWTTAEMWDSGKTAITAIDEGDRSGDITYAGSSLVDGTTYYWRIRFWDNSDATGEWSSTSQFSMNNAPTVSSVALNGGSDIDLLANSTQNVSFTATLTDLDGNADISGGSATGVMYRSGVTDAEDCSEDDANCYPVASCSITDCSGNTCTATCTAAVAFFADSTDAGTYSAEYWRAYIEATDAYTETGENFSTAGSPEMNSLLTIDTTSSIAYGSVNPGSSSSEQSITVTNQGNRPLDVRVSGDDMCVNYPTGCGGGTDIGVGNQEYSSSSFTYGAGTVLTSSLSTLSLGIPKSSVVPSNSTDTVYWHIGIPANTLPGNYTGSNTVVSIASD